MADAAFRTPDPINEPVKSYARETPERARLAVELEPASKEVAVIPVALADERLTKGRKTSHVVMPHAHAHVLAHLQHANAADVTTAIERALAARTKWSAMPFAERAAIFLRAADLLA